ncbi:Tripartite-type tricarboxylate transporter, receptor component TctC [Polaromonas sp. OV174]|uniref:Bug family tripartite tricarboxylate transporter substrate binding protein n=1 Tax=Polaromonas sp. OV174 TaxID=1855300 RepID=UPI0008F060BF|nr:tripartite tricarboxylate transporter substrate binding protein [Polaromonas sp. OV174]SFC43963.1 Tripartite-type tricarboxylate transporter, receptor component TctC [Polaromonas sp. OV174]
MLIKLKHSSTQSLGRLLAGLVVSVVASAAMAAWPEKPITIVVPFAPGGSSDIVARNLAPMLGERLGQAVVIENVAGAGGMLGTQRAVRAAPDGYTILLGSGSEILINKLINPKVATDGIKDLSPVVFVGTGPMVLVGKAGLPANSVADVLALARAKPGTLSYASAGNGTPMHVAGELLKMRADVFMTHIPYRGAAPALIDLIGGQIDLGVSTLSAAQPYIKSGKIKAFAVTSAKPSELAPGIPAMGQVKGLEGFDLGVWFGLFLPNKTPPEILQKVQTAAQQVLADPQVKKRLAEQGISASGASAAELSKFMATEVEKYRAVVKAAKITAE